MKTCPNCGAETEVNSKFCRNCGAGLNWTPEEANTWRLAPNTTRDPSPSPAKGLGDWLLRGWQLYKEYWVEMSIGSLIGAVVSTFTLGLLFGPTLLGLYRMAFKAMRGERPDVGDIFEWEGRFQPAVVTFFVYFVVHLGIGGDAKSGI